MIRFIKWLRWLWCVDPDPVFDLPAKRIVLLLTKMDADMGILKKMLETKDNFGSELLKLTRHNLGSIDLSDIEDKMTPQEHEAFNAQVSAVYEQLILPTLKRLSRTQEGFTARLAANWDQSCFGRGTINGIELVREEFEKAYNAHKASLTKPEQPSQPHNPLPEIS